MVLYCILPNSVTENLHSVYGGSGRRRSDMPPHLNGNTGVHKIKKETARLRIETRNWDLVTGTHLLVISIGTKEDISNNRNIMHNLQLDIVNLRSRTNGWNTNKRKLKSLPMKLQIQSFLTMETKK